MRAVRLSSPDRRARIFKAGRRSRAGLRPGVTGNWLISVSQLTAPSGKLGRGETVLNVTHCRSAVLPWVRLSAGLERFVLSSKTATYVAHDKEER